MGDVKWKRREPAPGGSRDGRRTSRGSGAASSWPDGLESELLTQGCGVGWTSS